MRIINYFLTDSADIFLSRISIFVVFFSPYEVICGPYSPVFGAEITSYLDTFHAVYNMTTLLLITFNRLPVLFNHRTADSLFFL